MVKTRAEEQPLLSQKCLGTQQFLLDTHLQVLLDIRLQVLLDIRLQVLQDIRLQVLLDIPQLAGTW